MADSADTAGSGSTGEKSAMRPRIIYLGVYTWAAATGGKFTAPFLQYLSTEFNNDAKIGAALALQCLTIALFASWGGSLADYYERKTKAWGLGHVKVLAVSVSLGSCTILLHALPDADLFPMPRVESFLFPWHTLVRVIYALFLSIVVPTLDGLTLAHLKREGGTSADYGKERMYGAIYWGVGSFVTGAGVDRYGFNFMYALAILGTLLSYVTMSVYLWSTRRDTTGSFDYRPHQSPGKECEERMLHHEENNIDSKKSINEEETITLSQLLKTACTTGYGQALLFFTFVISIGVSVVDQLAFLFFDELGSSETINGLTVVFSVMFETPIFYLAPSLLNKYGPGKLMLVAGLAYVFRVIGYTFVPDGKMYLIFLLDLTHGITYAGSKTASVEYIAKLMPEGYEASGQGVLTFVSYTGMLVGLVVGGWLQQAKGPTVMYRTIAALVSLGLLALTAAEMKHDREDCRASGGEAERLVKSASCSSSTSAFADESTEVYLKKLKYDSLQKYTKDW